MRGAWDHRQLGMADAAIHGDCVLQRHLVIVADHHQRSACNSVQIVSRDRRLLPVHARELRVHLRVMIGAIR
jgi:hypothetical protein